MGAMKDKMKNMSMTKEEIEASKKKLGLDKSEKTKKLGLCQANACSKHGKTTCKYCNRVYCETHAESKLTMSAKYVWSMDKFDLEKFNKYNEDWQTKDGHPCVKYTEVWNASREEKKAEEYKRTNNAYNTLFSGSRANKNYQQSNNYQSSNQGYTSYGNYGRNTPRNSQPYLSMLYDKWLLKNALIFSIIIAIVATLPIGLVSMSGMALNTSLFIASGFLIDFVVIFIIFVIYRKIAASSISYWAGMTTSILSSVLLLSAISFTSITSVPSFIEVMIFLFIASYAGNLVGKGLNGRTYYNKRKAVIYSGKVILIIFAIIILAGLSLHVSAFLKTSSNLGSSNYSLVNNSLSDIGKISNTIGPTLLPPTINGTWATAFFSNVSTQRGEPYTYCANLSTFAKTRFNTMAQNYGISHYGYSEDFNKTWPYGVEYGDEIYYGFGEEVFYPSGYNASNYVQQIITTAPLHWQELENDNLTTYGYYIANGPAYEILGPDGGYSACPVTEIPGPNINISQYFAQYGCSVETANLTYFVIELAPFCPYGG
jgi:hypothetical protein